MVVLDDGDEHLTGSSMRLLSPLITLQPVQELDEPTPRPRLLRALHSNDQKAMRNHRVRCSGGSWPKVLRKSRFAIFASVLQSLDNRSASPSCS